MPSGTPLNGMKIHPLTASAIDKLIYLHRYGPLPRQEINAGQVSRLMAENLIETVSLPSPYKTVKGDIAFSTITEAGRQRLRDLKRI